MVSIAGGLLAVFLPLLLQQEMIQDRLQAGFNEAMATASAEGLPALVRRLDVLANASPSSPFTPVVYATIQVIGLLHPGSVPDQAGRLQTLKTQGGGTPGLAKVLKQVDLLQAYYAAAARGRPESGSAGLADPIFEGSLLGVQALADAALRARDYRGADALARQVVEADPFSPLLANAHVILGLSAAYRGDSKAALRHFQHALAASQLATIYGNTQDFLFATYRFSRPVPALVGDVFDEIVTAHLATTAGLKDPKSLIRNNRDFVLVDREQTLTISPEGKILDTKPARNLEDVAAAGGGKLYALMDNGIDLGTGKPTTLSLSIGGKPKALSKLRSLAVDDRGDIYLLDQDAGLLRCSLSAAGSPDVSSISPAKGRLIRIDSRSYLYVLAPDGKSILVFSREGRQLTSVIPAPTVGKESAIEFFALDALNHLYILDSNSIQIFAMVDGSAGLDKRQVSAITLDSRPQFKNLKVLGVTAAGETVVTGKNEDNWVCFR